MTPYCAKASSVAIPTEQTHRRLDQGNDLPAVTAMNHKQAYKPHPKRLRGLYKQWHDFWIVAMNGGLSINDMRRYFRVTRIIQEPSTLRRGATTVVESS